MEVMSNRYKVDSSYPCWYNTKRPSEVTWYMPTTSYALILLIISGISVPFAIVFLIIFYRLRERADL
ncbi:unnamed protein product [Rotaria sordida]|uniref:Uncharacterized protein n=1 Tax=Rotaria sordida TaxID=392033 RepID=A0A814UAW5_9BILA|nr:unnamed protein product [Rotaria sordida]CAF1460257.1 unnamed protein product [Rotaria sordida]